MSKSLGLLVFFLGTALGAGNASADSVIVCPPGSTAYFYLLDTWPNGGLTTDNEYTGVGPDGRDHLVELLSVYEANLFAVCSTARSTFEASLNLQLGLRIPNTSELWKVHDRSTNALVGTVWSDELPPFARGGSMSFQRFYECKQKDKYTGVVSNMAVFGTMLDTTAIDANEPEKSLYFTDPLLRILLALGDSHMRNPNGADCNRELEKDSFTAVYGIGASLHYLTIDPVVGVGGVPDP